MAVAVDDTGREREEGEAQAARTSKETIATTAGRETDREDIAPIIPFPLKNRNPRKPCSNAARQTHGRPKKSGGEAWHRACPMRRKRIFNEKALGGLQDLRGLRFNAL